VKFHNICNSILFIFTLQNECNWDSVVFTYILYKKYHKRKVVTLNKTNHIFHFLTFSIKENNKMLWLQWKQYCQLVMSCVLDTDLSSQHFSSQSKLLTMLNAISLDITLKLLNWKSYQAEPVFSEAPNAQEDGLITNNKPGVQTQQPWYVTCSLSTEPKILTQCDVLLI